MRIVAPQGCVSVRVADESLRREVEQALSTAGVDVCVGTVRSGPGLVCIALAPNSPDRVGEALAPCPGEGPLAPAVVLLARRGCLVSRVRALDAGAAELLSWPEQAAELPAVLRAIVRRRLSDLGVHPLTRLPGAGALHDALRPLLAHGGSGALLAVDIERFKALNDAYGFVRGDQVLLYLGRLLQESAGPDDRVFHLGGDDFFVLTCAARAHRLAQWLTARFDREAPEFYDEEARRRGYIAGVSRETGMAARFELMTLSVVVAGLGGRPGEGVAELAARVARLKLRAQQGRRGSPE